MDKWILVAVLMSSDDPQAIGPFRSERACLQFTVLLNAERREWLGRCMPEAEYRSTFSHLRLQRDS